MKKRSIGMMVLLISAALCGCSTIRPNRNEESSQEVVSSAENVSDKSVNNDVESNIAATVQSGADAGGKENDTSVIDDAKNETEAFDGSVNEKEELEKPETQTEQEVQKQKEQESQEVQKQKEQERALIRQRYAEALSEMIDTYQLPEGDIIANASEWNVDMNDNHYAICDVDGDGREELIISYATGSMADMFEAVYGYDPEKDTLTQELKVFPWVEYYDNGMLLAYASHNHSYGDFWPVGLYRYDADQNMYVQIAYVDTWDKNAWESIYDYESETQKPFPAELDTDEDGILYNIREGDPEDYIWSYQCYRYNEEDYQKWYASYMQGAKKLMLEYQAISCENVNNIQSTES